MILEGRKWHQVAKENGYPLRGAMQRGKVYLYQIYTTIFVEFDTVEAAEDFRKSLDCTFPYWDYDPLATLDTNKAETAERWSNFIVEDE